MPYWSARDLPTFQEMEQSVKAGKLLTRFVAGDQRSKLLEIEEQMNAITDTVDRFYERLGQRNWIFHDSLSLTGIKALLEETQSPGASEKRLIEMYRDPETTKFWMMRLQNVSGLRERYHQIARARVHYDEGHFDSCVLQLIVVMDGFVNDYQPAQRKGLAARDPDEMAAWDSVVGHHLGLTHALNAFTKTIRKRKDEEVFNLYRHGIVHGSVVKFDNVVVATKAWNMLFALVDWAAATGKAAEPEQPQPSLKEPLGAIRQYAERKRNSENFGAFEMRATESGFDEQPVVIRAGAFFSAWEKNQWGILADFLSPRIRTIWGAEGRQAVRAKGIYEAHSLTNFEIKGVAFPQASAAVIDATATINNTREAIEVRWIHTRPNGNLATADDDDADWHIAVYPPETFIKNEAE